MPQFKYRAKKGPEEVIEGVIEAQSEKEAVDKISQLGLLPVRVEQQDKPSVYGRDVAVVSAGRLGIKSREITIVTRQLASLLKSGVPILSSLNIISEQSQSSALRGLLRSVYNNVKEGATFSSSLARYPGLFQTLYIAMVHTGEDSGQLPQALLRVAEYRAKQEELMSRFRMAMAYPVLMAVVGVGTIIFMLTFVMPRLLNIFSGMGQALPLPTRILIAVSGYARQWWAWAVIAAAVLIIRRVFISQAASGSLGAFKLRIPVFGELVLKSELGRFTRTMELLIKSGIPILKAIDIAIPVLSNEVLKRHLGQSYKELEQGGSFGKSLKKAGIFPLFMSNLIIIGEESGRLDDALGEVAATYERDTDEAMRMLASLLEPLMILVMGIIVGFIVIAMLLPLFEINVMAGA